MGQVRVAASQSAMDFLQGSPPSTDCPLEPGPKADSDVEELPPLVADEQLGVPPHAPFAESSASFLPRFAPPQLSELGTRALKWPYIVMHRHLRALIDDPMLLTRMKAIGVD